MSPLSRIVTIKKYFGCYQQPCNYFGKMKYVTKKDFIKRYKKKSKTLNESQRIFHMLFYIGMNMSSGYKEYNFVYIENDIMCG